MKIKNQIKKKRNLKRKEEHLDSLENEVKKQKIYSL